MDITGSRIAKIGSKDAICRDFTGATGLEPATSGATGHYHARDMNDDGHRIALFMRFLSPLVSAAAWLSQAISDVCCPIAARVIVFGRGPSSQCLRRPRCLT
jgi:hypothetical protein